ncbi:MAG: hypothetical protein K6F25_05650 [Bacteroidales bacterium]|nr:hypothetical protein [Bacteroidales bacterium]
MKKILTYAALAFAALAAFSCQGVVEGPDASDGVLILSLDSGEMDTKAADTSFETAIDHFDYFFFADAEGTTPIEGMHGRAEGSSKRLDTQEGAEFAPLRARTSYVYVLANYPAALDHSHDWTLAQILALDVTAPILTGKETETNPITGDTEETGVVSFTENLVMDSWQEVEGSDVYTVGLTPAKIQEQRTVSVPLTRLAAKITVDIDITPSVTVAGNVWKPCPELLKAYYVNALNNKATVLGTPVKRAGLTDATGYEYVTYPQAYPMTPAPAKEVYKYTTDPVYTYPQEWASEDDGEPYFKIQMPWINDNGTDALSMGSSNFYYKVTIPKPGTDGEWTLERNKWYKVSLTLSMLSTLEDYAEIDFDCTVMPWAESGWTGGSGLSSARFFDVPTREFTLYSDEELAIPYSSSSTVSAYFEEISYWFYGSTNGTHYHFRFDTADKISQVTLPTDKDSDNQSLNVTNYAGTSVDAAKDLNEFKLEADGKFVNFTHKLNDVFTVRKIKILLVNADGRSAEVFITQRPAIEVAARNSKNAFLDGWYYLGNEDVCDADGNLTGYTHTPTGNAYMPHIPYWRTRTNWASSGATLYGTLYAGGSTSVRADHYFLTEVSVSAFTEENNKYQVRAGSNTGTITTKAYRLGDPRVPASKHYNSTTADGATPRFVLKDYLYSDKARRNADGTQAADASADVTKPWEQPLKILIGTQNADDQNIIAPRLLISSHMNITDGVNWNNSDGTGVVQRCAMYQEAGYPAGRWRLPTEAEFAFMMKLQADGTLPGLFANSCYYRIADGRKIHIGIDGNVTPFTADASGKVYIRMVYDLWYWGDDPTEDALKYHPESEMTDWEKADDNGNGIPNWKEHWADYYHPNMHER